jgi:hypothetical protein
MVVANRGCRSAGGCGVVLSLIVASLRMITCKTHVRKLNIEY